MNAMPEKLITVTATIPEEHKATFYKFVSSLHGGRIPDMPQTTATWEYHDDLQYEDRMFDAYLLYQSITPPARSVIDYLLDRARDTVTRDELIDAIEIDPRQIGGVMKSIGVQSARIKRPNPICSRGQSHKTYWLDPWCEVFFTAARTRYGAL